MKPNNPQPRNRKGNGSPCRPMWCGYRNRHPVHHRLAMAHRQPVFTAAVPVIIGATAMTADTAVLPNQELRLAVTPGQCRRRPINVRTGANGARRRAASPGWRSEHRHRNHGTGPWRRRRAAVACRIRIPLTATEINRPGPPPCRTTGRSVAVRDPRTAVGIRRPIPRPVGIPDGVAPVPMAMAVMGRTGHGRARWAAPGPTGSVCPVVYGPGDGDPEDLPGSSNSQLITEFAVINVNSSERYSLRSQLPEQCRGYLVDTEVLVSIDDLNERVLI